MKPDPWFSALVNLGDGFRQPYEDVLKYQNHRVRCSEVKYSQHFLRLVCVWCARTLVWELHREGLSLADAAL